MAILKNITFSIVLVLFALIYLNSCSYTYLEVKKIETKNNPKFAIDYIGLPVKAHLKDGSLIIYENGFYFNNDTVWGNGLKYNLLRENKELIKKIPYDSVVTLIHYDENSDTNVLLTSIPAGLAPAIIIPMFIVLYFGY